MAIAKPNIIMFPLFQCFLQQINVDFVKIHALGSQKGFEKFCMYCCYGNYNNTIITTHDVSHHMYADDKQVYIELSQSDTHKSISSLSDCLTDISLWMKSSKLKLNSF